jgi:long-chain acyl-CoA synthetase
LREYASRAGAGSLPGPAAGLTFADADALSDRLAGVLQAQGILPHDRVAVFMDSSPQALVAIFATLKIGALFCPVDAGANSEGLAFILNDSPAACLFVDARFAPVAAAAMAEAPLLRLVVVAGAEGAPAIDGLIRFEDAVVADARPLSPSGGSGLDPAMLFYPRQGHDFTPSAVVTHAEVLEVAYRCFGRPVGDGLFPPFLAFIAGMRAERDALPGVAA